MSTPIISSPTFVPRDMNRCRADSERICRSVRGLLWQAGVIVMITLATILAIKGRAFAQEIAIPPLTAPVIDNAGILSPSQQKQLLRKLNNAEQEKGAQIVVLTIASLQGLTPEAFALEVASRWQLGRKGIDDGVLLLIAPQERAVRIEVGRGLEGALPDVVAFRIIDRLMTPLLKQQRYGEGIEVGVDAIIAAVRGEPLPKPRSKTKNSGDSPLVALLFAGVLIGSLLAPLLGREPAAVVTSLGVFALGLFLTSIFLALIATIFVFIISIAPPGRRGFGSGGFSAGRGGFGGGGGFSGGGGSFGGGGASGRW